MTKRVLLLSIVLWLGVIASLLAGHHVKRVSVAEGVLVPLVSQTYIDDAQNVWLATMGQGLLWWNGHAFVPPFSENALQDPFVLEVFQKGTDFILLTEQYLVKYDGFSYNHMLLPESERIVSAYLHDDHIYVLSQGNGLWVQNDSVWEHITQGSTSFRFNDVVFMEGVWWFATANGVWEIGDEVRQVGLSDIHVRKWYTSPDGDLYAATTKGLYRWDGAFVVVFDSVDVRDVAYHQGELFAATSTQGILREHQSSISMSSGIHSNQIRSIAFDGAGRLWYTTVDGMGVVTSLKERSFFQENIKYYRGLISQNRHIWLTGNMGWILERESDTLTGALEPGIVFAMTEDGYGNVLIAGENGIDIRSANGTRLSFLRDALPDPFITSMAVIDDILFLGCASGIYKITNYLEQPKVDMLYAQGVSHLALRGQQLVALSFINGVLVFDSAGKMVENYSEFADSSALSLLPSALSVDDSGFIWMGTSNAGAFVQTNSGWKNMAIEGERTIYDWYPVGGRKMVAITENHLMLVVANNDDFIVYRHPYETFIPDGYSDRAYPFGFHNGLLYLTSIHGRHVIDTELFYYPLESNADCMPMLWRMDLYFDIHTRWRDKSEDLSPFTGVPQHVVLSYKENYLRFLFGAPKLPLLDGHLVYRYRMNPMDPNWIDIDGAPEAVYANMSPGRYTFELQARWPHGQWSPTKHISIQIVPPWYRTWWFYVSSFALLVFGTYIIVRIRIKQQNERIRLENAVLANERVALRLQMNPHFLFNALESIGSFVLKNDPKSTMKYLNSFTKLMRLTLEAGTDKDHPVENEITLLKSYVTLEQLRFSHKFDVEFEIDENIDYDIAIPPMLVQPHVENAIIHGLRDLEERRGKLVVRFILTDANLVVEIEDNGVGREANRSQKRKHHRSMALEINRKRIELLSKSFHREFSLKIHDLYHEGNAAGTKVVITLPIIYLDDL